MKHMSFRVVLCLLLAFAMFFGAQCEETTTERKNLTPIGIIQNMTMSVWPFAPDYKAEVIFYLFTQKNIDAPRQLRKGDGNALNFSDFEKSRKTFVLLHGFNNDVNSPITQDVKNGLLKFEDVNVISIDWSYFTKNINYMWLVTQVKGVGTYIGEFIDFLIDRTGLSPDNVHMIGHSIGAHAAGFAAKKLKAKGRTIGRISGLDPAWPGFYTSGPKSRLASTDAKFVDCVHSCGGLLGFPMAICQADFFPNSGNHPQPGCDLLDFGACSHGRAFEYFAESIDPSHIFSAQKCDSYLGQAPHNCTDVGALMGYPASDKFLGNYYLKTESTYPYANNKTSSE